ncbi:MAG: OsmC family protein [Acidobacteriota bacterium]|nr:OsmC family protein [Acidobacteriota bacterium]
MTDIAVTLKQHDSTASIATIRNHQIVMDRPEAKGGHNVGPMGGEALLASLGGCFMSNLRAAIAARENVGVRDIALSITATVAPDSSRFSAIHLRVSAKAETVELQKLVTIADRSCIAANTLRQALELTVSVE